MSIQLLEAAAAALGDLLAEVVFVGGATVRRRPDFADGQTKNPTGD